MSDKKTVAESVEVTALPDNDSLRVMFDMQRKILDDLVRRCLLPSNFWDVPVDSPQFQILIKDYLLCIVDECSEILNWTPWKHWKTKQDPTNIEEIKWEIVDIFHFLMNISMLVGMSSNEFFAIYKAKNRKNLERYRDGY